MNLRGPWERQGSEHADAAETFSGRSAAAAATGLPQATGGARAGEPEQPEVTRGLWLTDALEHMADTPLGTSRLGRRGTLQGDSFIYFKHIYLFIYLLKHLPTFCQALLEVLELQEKVEINTDNRA